MTTPDNWTAWECLRLVLFMDFFSSFKLKLGPMTFTDATTQEDLMMNRVRYVMEQPVMLRRSYEIDASPGGSVS